MRIGSGTPDPADRRMNRRGARERTSANEMIMPRVHEVPKNRRRKSRKRVALPLIRSKKPGTLHLDNDKIFESISLP